MTEQQPLPEVPEGDLWVFAYGSLMWRPGFRFAQRYPARLHGYRRALCVWSWVHRGTRAVPGLVLGLDRGGSCLGCAYRVDAGRTGPVLDYLYRRELVTDVYRARLVPIRVRRTTVRALTFIVRREHAQYAGYLDPDRAAGVVRHAVGASGPNVDYLRSTLEHLQDMGIRESYLQRVRASLGPGEDLASAAATDLRP